MLAIPKCEDCGAQLPLRAKTGPPRRYCDGACRQRALRRRRTGREERRRRPVRGEFRPASAPPAPALPAPPPMVAPIPNDEQLAIVLTEVRAATATLHRLGSDARPEFRWRAEELANVIEAGLFEYFDGIV